MGKFEAQPEVTVFFHMRSLNTATVPSKDRYTVSRVSSNGSSTFRLVVRHGYNDHVTTADLARLVLEQLNDFIIHEGAQKDEAATSNDKQALETSHGSEKDNDRVAAELELVRKAHGSQVIYLVGKERLRVRDDVNIFRRILLSAFIWMRDNTRSRVAAMKLPGDHLVEMGFVMEV